jgi:hypothetical protein
MADVFKASGYRTGMFGKWHLGSNYPFRPIDRGFDEWLGQGDGGTGTTDDYFTNDRVNDHYWHNGRREYREGYAPDVFFHAAIDFLKDQDVDAPFFIYLTTYIPHSPHTVADRDWTSKYESEVGKAVAYFFAGIERVDWNIGRLRRELEALGLAENTILIFMTDNGGTTGVRLFNAGMRGQKGTVYDGGHRVPLFIHWPAGDIKHGSDVTDLNAHIDLLPTLVDVCQLTPAKDIDFDGRSFRQQLYAPQTALSERTLFVEKQRTYRPEKWQNAVAMTNRWRLVNSQELYDIKSDRAQEKNVFEEHPDIVEQLNHAFDQYWQRVSPNDRDRVTFVVGHPCDHEVFLQPMDWYLPSVPWNHQHTSQGASQSGSWLIKAAEQGTYRFEVRRWPKEIDAPIAGIPTAAKSVDAWDARGSKAFLLYGGTQSPYKALPVAFIRLKVGDWECVRAVDSSDAKVIFDVPLEPTEHEVRAELLNDQHEVIAGGYYVYCSKS